MGDFSRATHLSIKTLRHYHQVGLIKPAAVNPDVKAVLATADAPARNALIAAHLGRLEAELAQTRAAAELAIIVHYGSLADADLSYAKLGSYATTHEISIDGPLREY